MINDPNLINNMIKEIQNISFEDLDYAIQLADKEFFGDLYFDFDIQFSYVPKDYYIYDKNLEKFNNVHIENKKSFWNIFKKNKQENIIENKINLEAA